MSWHNYSCISDRSVGEGFHSSEWAVQTRAVAEAVTLRPTCAVEAKLKPKAIAGHKNTQHASQHFSVQID